MILLGIFSVYFEWLIFYLSDILASIKFPLILIKF